MSTQLAQTFQNLADKQACMGNWDLGYCSTCGCFNAINIIKEVENLEEELLNINIETVKNYNYVDALNYKGIGVYVTYLVFILLRVDSIDREKVLLHWLNTIDEKYVRLFDGVLFYVIRRMEDSMLKEKWMQKCESIASTTNDVSLWESLYYTARKNCSESLSHSKI